MLHPLHPITPPIFKVDKCVYIVCALALLQTSRTPFLFRVCMWYVDMPYSTYQCDDELVSTGARVGILLLRLFILHVLNLNLLIDAHDLPLCLLFVHIMYERQSGDALSTDFPTALG